jgi:uncharacterized membrane protein YjfL (UPF0719 family)
MPEPDAGAIQADHPAHAVTAERLFAAIWSLAVLGTIIGVGRHDADALAELTPSTLVLGERLAAIPFQAWIYAGTHLLAGLASLALGYLAVSFAYPRRHLAREAHLNPAAAIQASAHLLGAAVISTVSWGGCDAPSLLISGVFCLLGWISLAAICAAHRSITRYADHEEIAHGNIAAALASAGLHLGVALVVGHAIQGQFTGWRSSLSAFALALAWVIVLYPLRQLVLARLILRMTPAEMDAGVSTRHDPWLGAAEGIFYLLAALCLSAGW